MSSTESKQIIHTEQAPAAIGPYSQAVRIGNLIYTAGQIALDPQTMEIVGGGIQTETRQVLNNLKQVLEAAGSGLSNVVKTTVFLQDMAEFTDMNEVYGEFFPKNPPARSAVAVKTLPKNVSVEIEAVAFIAS